MFSWSEFLSLRGLRPFIRTQLPLSKGTYNSCRAEVNTADVNNPAPQNIHRAGCFHQAVVLQERQESARQRTL